MADERPLKMQAIADGLRIFIANGGRDTCAEHDIIYASHDGRAMGAEDIAQLYHLGWFIESTLCRGCAKEGESSHMPKHGGARHSFTCIGWAIFT